MTLENKHKTLFTEYQTDLILRLNHSKSHAQKSVTNLRSIFVQLKKEYSDVTRTDLVHWLRDQAVSGITAKTIRNRVSTLRSFYVWLIEIGKATHDPTQGLRLPKATLGPGCGAYSLIEIKRLIAATQSWEAGGDARRSPWGPVVSRVAPNVPLSLRQHGSRVAPLDQEFPL